MADVSRILSAAEAGDPAAAQELLPLVYNELRKLAAPQQCRCHSAPKSMPAIEPDTEFLRDRSKVSLQSIAGIRRRAPLRTEDVFGTGPPCATIRAVEPGSANS